jgi:hypothetical protein
MTGAMYPSEYVNSKDAPVAGAFCVDTYASIDAKIGVLQGDAANANVSPAAYARAMGGRPSERTSTSSDGKRSGRTSKRLSPIKRATAPTPA